MAETEARSEEGAEHEGLAGTFHEKVIALDTMGLRLLGPTAIALSIIIASAVLLATRDAGWPLVSTGAVVGSTLGTVPLPVAVLATITVILAWTFIVSGALHAHLALRVVAVAVYAFVGFSSGIIAGTPLTAVIVTLAVFSVVAVAVGLYLTDRGNRHQAPHLHHRSRLRLSTFLWVLFATTLIYGLDTVTGLQRGGLGSFLDVQLGFFSLLLVPVLLLAGTDFAEWSEVVSGRLSTLVEQLPRPAVLGALVVAGLGILAWAYVLNGGGFSFQFSAPGTALGLAPVVGVAIPVVAVAMLALRRPLSTRVPFWALAIGAVALYLGIIVGGLTTLGNDETADLPPLVAARSTQPPPYSLLVPQAWSKTPVAGGEVWSGTSDGRPARMVLLWGDTPGARSLSSALGAPVSLDAERSEGGWRAARATTSIAGQAASGPVWTKRAAGESWTLAGVREGGASVLSSALFDNARTSFTADPDGESEDSGDASGTLLTAAVAAAFLIALGLTLLVVGRGEVATGGLFLFLSGLFSAAGPLVARPLVAHLGDAVGAVSPSSLDLAGGYAAIVVVVVTSLVPRWRLPIPILRLILVLVLGLAGLHFLYDGVFGTALSVGERFTVIQAVVLVAAMLWDVLMSGESFTNAGGIAVPRHTRVLIYMGYTMLVVTAVLFLSSVQAQGGGSAGQGFESDTYPQLGIYALGPPLLITFFLVNLSAWRHARPLARPDSLDQVDRSVLAE